MDYHVFVDNSNIFGGARRAAASIEKQFPWPTIRVHFPNLVKLIEGGQSVATRVLAGSVPPGNEELWKYARDLGYNADLLRRIAADDGRLVEQGVDELLHLKIANVLLDAGARTGSYSRPVTVASRATERVLRFRRSVR